MTHHAWFGLTGGADVLVLDAGSSFVTGSSLIIPLGSNPTGNYLVWVATVGGASPVCSAVSMPGLAFVRLTTTSINVYGFMDLWRGVGTPTGSLVTCTRSAGSARMIGAAVRISKSLLGTPTTNNGSGNSVGSPAIMAGAGFVASETWGLQGFAIGHGSTPLPCVPVNPGWNLTMQNQDGGGASGLAIAVEDRLAPPSGTAPMQHAGATRQFGSILISDNT